MDVMDLFKSLQEEPPSSTYQRIKSLIDDGEHVYLHNTKQSPV